MFIKMEPSSDTRARWQARVFLRQSFEYDGKNGRGHERRFPGWVQVPTIELDFATTHSPEDLELLIARAQLATLAPGNVPPQTFLHGSLAVLGRQYSHAPFSPNTVCIDISGPTLSSLSFYDLPGIIGQSEDQSSHFLVKFVKDLVTEFIKEPESLILVTCSLGNDIHNSTAAGIARELNSTDRCVGKYNGAEFKVRLPLT